MASSSGVSASAKIISQTIPNAAHAATTAAATSTASNALKAAWIRGMPTRAIAAALLDAKHNTLTHEELFKVASESDLIRSRRHFKQCLRLLKDQKRTASFSLGPERVGSANIKFAVRLTLRGEKIYSKYRITEGVERGNLGNDGNDSTRGLQDALV